MENGLEQLKKQGLKEFTALYRDGGDFLRIWMEGQNKRSRHRKHLWKKAQRLICEGCQLRTNKGPIRCNGIDPERPLWEDSAVIKNEGGLSETYWRALSERLPCRPRSYWDSE